MKIDRRIIVLAVFASLLIVAAVYYYAVRPGAEKVFKYDVIKAMENLNEVMYPFWENYTISGVAAEHYLANSSAYFMKAADKAKVLLIDSTPYSKLSEVINEIVELLHKNSSFIYSIWATWNDSEEGLPYRTICPWNLNNLTSESPDDFVDDCTTTNWNMLIGFLESIVL